MYISTFGNSLVFMVFFRHRFSSSITVYILTSRSLQPRADIDPVSVQWALKNVSTNEWQKQIRVRLVQRDAAVLADALPPDET